MPEIPALQIPQMQSPLDAYAKVTNLQTLMQQKQLGAEQLRAARMENDQRQIDMQSQRAIQKAYMDSQGDIEKTIPLAAQYGAKPQALMQLKASHAEQQSKLASLDKANLENMKTHNDLIGQAVGSVLSLPPAQRKPALMNRVLPSLAQNGVLKPEELQHYVSQISQSDDLGLETMLKIHQLGTMSADKQISTILSQKESENKAPGQIADSLEKSNSLIAQNMGSAKGQMDWMERREFLRRKGIDISQVPEQYSPEAVQQMKALGYKPDAPVHTVSTAEGVFSVNQDGTRGNRIGSPTKALVVNNHPNGGGVDDIKVAAQQLVDPYNLTALKDIASLRGDQRLRIFAEAKKLDPRFDPGVTNQRIRFLQGYEDPKGRAAINRQSINNIAQHAGDLVDLNNQYRRSDVRALNTPINALSRQFGSQVYTQFSTVNSVLKDELSLYFAGGYAPTPDQQKMWSKIQSDEATPAQTEAFTREVLRLGFRRANTFNSQFKSMMGYDDPNMLIPEALSAADRLGVGDEARKFGSGGMVGVRPEQQSTGNDGEFVVIDPQGGRHGFPSRIRAEAFKKAMGIK